MSESEKAGLAIAKLAGFVALIATSSIWKGYVLSTLWGWFIVPAFGAPPLNIPLAIGLSLVVGGMTMTYRQEKQDTGFLVGMAIAMPALTLFMGWIVTKFL